MQPEPALRQVHLDDCVGASNDVGDLMRQVFERYWDDVAPLNHYTPETARMLLAREEARAGDVRVAVDGLVDLSDAFNDPWIAVKLGLRERAAGRLLTR